MTINTRYVLYFLREARIFLLLDRGLQFFHAWSGGSTFFFATHFSKKCLKSHYFFVLGGFDTFEAFCFSSWKFKEGGLLKFVPPSGGHFKIFASASEDPSGRKFIKGRYWMPLCWRSLSGKWQNLRPGGKNFFTLRQGRLEMFTLVQGGQESLSCLVRGATIFATHFLKSA